jgi:hypothetical protein
VSRSFAITSHASRDDADPRASKPRISKLCIIKQHIAQQNIT